MFLYHINFYVLEAEGRAGVVPRAVSLTGRPCEPCTDRVMTTLLSAKADLGLLSGADKGLTASADCHHPRPAAVGRCDETDQRSEVFAATIHT